MSYFDAAYIAKFYVDEPESRAVRQLAERLGRVHCCAFGRMEVASVFHRKWREGAFSDGAFRETCAQFTDDCESGLWTWLSVTDILITKTAASLRALGRGVTIRSADALHLICAQQHRLQRVYSNDRHMLLAAAAFGIEVKSV